MSLAFPTSCLVSFVPQNPDNLCNIVKCIIENPEDYDFKQRNSVAIEEITDVNPITSSSPSSTLPSECYCEAEDEM